MPEAPADTGDAEAAGDAELAAPPDDDGTLASGAGNAAAPEWRVQTRNPLVLMVAAILVLAVAQVVFAFLVFHTTSELRDQVTAQNGLSRCIDQVQLNSNQSTDPSGARERAAIQSCLNK